MALVFFFRCCAVIGCVRKRAVNVRPLCEYIFIFSAKGGIYANSSRSTYNNVGVI